MNAELLSVDLSTLSLLFFLHEIKFARGATREVRVAPQQIGLAGAVRGDCGGWGVVVFAVTQGNLSRPVVCVIHATRKNDFNGLYHTARLHRLTPTGGKIAVIVHVQPRSTVGISDLADAAVFLK